VPDDEKPLRDGALFVADDAYDEERDDEAGSAGSPGDGKAEQAADVLDGILARMDLDTEVTVRDDGEKIVLDVDGPDAGRAIGRKGQTLDALQFLVNKIVNRFPDGRRHVIVDSGDYRDRHDKGLVSMAHRQAKKAVQQGKVITLEPMSARDRRVIHLSLAKFPGVTTKSDGQGIGRRIQIIPAGGRAGGGRSRHRGYRGRERDRDDR
jgi:spoIIIJ-associated protein